MTRKKLYTLLAVACLGGYIYVGNTIFNVHNPDGFGVCIIKEATGFPCPSCGSTRSVLAILDGHFLEAVYWNPIGVVLSLILTITPFWLLFDVIKHQDSLLKFYTKIENLLRQKAVAIPAIALVLANWIWNYYKGL